MLASFFPEALIAGNFVANVIELLGFIKITAVAHRAGGA